MPLEAPVITVCLWLLVMVTRVELSECDSTFQHPACRIGLPFVGLMVKPRKSKVLPPPSAVSANACVCLARLGGTCNLVPPSDGRCFTELQRIREFRRRCLPASSKAGARGRSRTVTRSTSPPTVCIPLHLWQELSGPHECCRNCPAAQGAQVAGCIETS